MYAYLVQKKNKKINNIILYNPLSGEITKLNTENVDFKDIATIIYSEFKSKTK